MNKTRWVVSSYLCDLVMAICAIISGIAQLRHVIINWQDSTEESEDNP